MPEMPTRTDWLLRFIAGTDHYDGWVDRIRIMKGMFLFQAEGPTTHEMNYKFQPYDYGPFTPEIYRDLESLIRGGFIAQSQGEESYRVTQQGRDYLATIDFPQDSLNHLVNLRVELGDLGFRDLLKRVYKAHPESAKRSVARDVLG